MIGIHIHKVLISFVSGVHVSQSFKDAAVYFTLLRRLSQPGVTSENC